MLRKALLLPPLVFLLELILGGPGKWADIGGISIRYWLLFGTIVSLTILVAVYRPLRLRRDEVLLFFILTVGVLFWVALVPLFRWTSIRFAAADGDALLMLYLYFPLAHLVRCEVISWRRAKLWLVGASVVVAILHLVLFALGQIGGRAMGYGVAVLMTQVMKSPAIYIAYIGDFFRVMWISSLCILFAFLLVLRDIRGRMLRPILLLVLGAALLVTYTRGFWFGALIGAFLIQTTAILASFRMAGTTLELPSLRARTLVNTIAVVGLIAAVAVVTEFQVIERVGATFDSEKDVSVAVRSGQLRRLLAGWSEAPTLGTGFGSYVRGHPGSSEAPYSYELTGVTLLMKTGVIGVALAMSVALIFAFRARRAALCVKDPCWFSGWLALCLGFTVAFQTNPYLLNFVGMAIVLFLMVDVVDLETRCQRSPARREFARREKH